jgi:hypothetical protein
MNREGGMLLVQRDGSWRAATLRSWDNEQHLQTVLRRQPWRTIFRLTMTAP